ncbi:MAG: hypothetical protein EOP05_04300 [Proteobacteria bacterium]|nr:MAG: hypothetical protein EOP05_04300 [Pseudomonadota bacterium]
MKTNLKVLTIASILLLTCAAGAATPYNCRISESTPTGENVYGRKSIDPASHDVAATRLAAKIPLKGKVGTSRQLIAMLDFNYSSDDAKLCTSFSVFDAKGSSKIEDWNWISQNTSCYEKTQKEVRFYSVVRNIDPTPTSKNFFAASVICSEAP